jgi:hypothetical protein
MTAPMLDAKVATATETPNTPPCEAGGWRVQVEAGCEGILVADGLPQTHRGVDAYLGRLTVDQLIDLARFAILLRDVMAHRGLTVNDLLVPGRHFTRDSLAMAYGLLDLRLISPAQLERIGGLCAIPSHAIETMRGMCPAAFTE